MHESVTVHKAIFNIKYLSYVIALDLITFINKG